MRKMAVLFLLSIIMCSCKPPASFSPELFGGKKYDSVRSLVITGDSYVMAGMTETLGLGSVDAYLLITDKSGRLKKQETFGGKGDDRAYGLVQSPDGGFMLAGTTTSYGAGKTDIYIIRTDKKGKYVSAKVFGGPEIDESRSICQAAGGGYVIAGASNSFGTIYNMDAYIIRTDADGNCVWARTYGGDGNEFLNCITRDSDGNYIAAGTSSSRTRKAQEGYLIKIGADGALIWEKYISGGLASAAYSVIEFHDGSGYLVAAESSTKESSSDYRIVKVGKDGKEIWSYTYGGVRADYPRQAIETSDGCIFVAGVTESQGQGMTDVWLVKAGMDGKIIWQQTFGGSQDDYAGAVAEDADGGLVVDGWTKSFGNNDYEIFLLKTDKDGKMRK